MARFFSSAEPENYTNADMERGNELEPTAISMYEMETGNKATIIGFVEMDNGFAGCSPDRFVNDDGLAEVKCPNDVNFLKLLVNKEKAIDTKYIWQMQMQMLICEKKWCDFIAYNPNFTQNLFIHRFEADPEMQEKLKIGIEKGGKLIESIKNIIN